MNKIKKFSRKIQKVLGPLVPVAGTTSIALHSAALATKSKKIRFAAYVSDAAFTLSTIGLLSSCVADEVISNKEEHDAEKEIDKEVEDLEKEIDFDKIDANGDIAQQINEQLEENEDEEDIDQQEYASEEEEELEKEEVEEVEETTEEVPEEAPVEAPAPSEESEENPVDIGNDTPHNPEPEDSGK